MAGCPDIDGWSLKRNSFGQVGVPLHPSNGLIVGRDGIELNSVTQNFNEGSIPIFSVGPVPPSLKTNLNSSFSRINNTVTLLVSWTIDSWGDLVTPIDFVLPFEAVDPLVAHSVGRVRDVGTANYPRYVVLMGNHLGVRLIDDSNVLVSGGTPAILVAGDSIFFVCQYECKPDAQLLWS